MKLEVTREVVSDLWPLRESGDASADSRALIEAFLDEDRDFAATLRQSENLGKLVPVRLSPDAERRLLDDARERAHLKLVVIGGAILLAGLIVLVTLGGGLYAYALRS